LAAGHHLLLVDQLLGLGAWPAPFTANTMPAPAPA